MKLHANQEISKILGIYTCDKFIELIEDCYEIFHLYNVDDTDDWVKDIVGDHDIRNVRLCRTAILLSKLADKHANLLKRINRSCPGFWQRVQQQQQKLLLD